MPTYSELREASVAVGENNKRDCAVKAVALTCDIDYNTARDLLRKQGRLDRTGTYPYQTHAAIQATGATLEDRSFLIRSAKTVVSLERALKLLDPTGTYLIHVRRHVLTFTDGRISDWSAGRRHRLLKVYKVTRSTVMPTATKTAKKSTKKTAAKSTTKKAAAAKKTSAKKTATKTPEAPKAPKPGTGEVKWSEKRMMVVKALKAAKATSEINALSAATIVEKGGQEITINDVKHYCYKDEPMCKNGFTGVAKVEGSRELGYYLTDAGNALKF